jgi:signal transduction histidine kinase/CheY-like chemotaxis protein/HPt (histidine-containing phosphotransfer) domain-containing protein
VSTDLAARVTELERALSDRDATIARLQKVRSALIARALRSSSAGGQGGYGLLESQARLAAQVRDHTRDLEALSEKLLAAKEDAEAAMRARTTFLATMSHEIRSPLHGIIGYTELMLEADDLATVRRHAGVVLRESELLLTLIDDILDYAKIDAGRLDLEHVPLDPRAVVDSVFAVQQQKAATRGLHLGATVDADVPHRLEGDPMRLRQILLNLVDNAVKFTPSGSVHVRVTVSHDAPRRLRFEVEDTGIGIPIAKQALIFESFTQADDGTARRYGGTGLGTSIARRLVVLMGGEIGVRSQPGVGSVFWFTVPCTAIGPVQGEGAIGPDEASAECADCLQQEQPGCGRRVLVVDDHPTNRDLLSHHLRSAGYEVDCAPGAQAGLDACASGRFDLVVLDVQMPEMDGYEAARRLRASSDWRRTVPIVALTADVRAECRAACHAAGMDAVVHKPIRRAGLLEALARVLCTRDPVQAGTATRRAPTDGAEEPNCGRCGERSTDVPPPPIDVKVAVEEFGGRDAFEHVATRFLARVRAQIETLDTAVAECRLATVRAEAHSLTGGAGMIEAMPLMKAARRLEEAAQPGGERLLLDLLADVRLEAARLEEHLRRDAAAVEVPGA